MKKKIAGLVLVAVFMLMALMGLTSCSNDSDGGKTQNRNYVTLSMWLIWEQHDPNDATALETEAKVEEAFNAVCTEKYSTKVVFTWCASEEEYKTALAARYKKAAESGVTPVVPSDDESGSQDGTLNSDYPELMENQLDIVLMLDKDMYVTYADEGKLSQLDSMLAGTYKNVNNELNSIIKYAKLATANANGTYAIPNLGAKGKYTYLFVNKEAATAFGFTGKDFATVSDAAQLVDAMTRLRNEADTPENVKNMVPVLEEFDYTGARFFISYSAEAAANPDGNPWVADSTFKNKNGLLGVFSAGKTYGGINNADISLSLDNQDYLNYLALMNWCRRNNGFAADRNTAYAGHNFAVAVLEGDYSMRKEFSDYYCIVLDNPRLTDSDLYHGMLSVSAYSQNPSRAMEIIAALQTGGDLSNILVHGVKDEHYTYNSLTGCVTSIGTYYVDPAYVGNLFYMYPDTSRGQSAEWLADMTVQKSEWLRDAWAGFQYVYNDENQEYNIIYSRKNQVDLLQSTCDTIFNTLMDYDTGIAGQSLEDYSEDLSAKAAEFKATYFVDGAPENAAYAGQMASSEETGNGGAVTLKYTIGGNVRKWWEDTAALNN